jgi:flagellar biosynthesis GTPase FlhF
MGKILPPTAVQFLSVLILAFFWVGTALADKRVALVIGISQYTRIAPRLANPVNDAHDIAQALESIGFEVILKTDIAKGEFDRSLAEFARKASGADTAVFYYAGHGLQFHGQNFLPVDIEVQDSADVEFQAVSMGRILEAINQSAGVKIIILDACRDNPLAKQLVAADGSGGEITRGLARIDSAEKTIVAYATAPDHVANDDEGRNSPFTAALIRRIKEPGLEITTMFRRVANDVYAQTGGKQLPEITSSLRTDYFLNPAESDSAAWSRVRELTNPADFKEFIQKFPASPFAREAQFRIDLFDRIRRETAEAKKEAERVALAAEKKRQEEAAAKEAERLAVEAEKKRQEVAAKKEAERLALEAEKEAERLPTRKEEDRRAEFEAALEEERRKHKILETGYSLLKDIGGEEPDYGLYSYAILVNDSDRSAKFLGDVFGDGFNAIPPVEETAAQPTQTNILYIPLKRSKAKEWTKGLKVGKKTALRAAYAKHFYDYTMSRALLDHLCVSPAEEIKAACEGDLSRGPYIFAYAKPASKVTPVPPPFLFMDLSDVHERAFPEIIAAFKAQVKREDISDRAKIDTLRLKVLNIVLTTADWLVPVRKAVADIVYSASEQTEKDKK